MIFFTVNKEGNQSCKQIIETKKRTEKLETKNHIVIGIEFVINNFDNSYWVIIFLEEINFFFVTLL